MQGKTLDGLAGAFWSGPSRTTGVDSRQRDRAAVGRPAGVRGGYGCWRSVGALEIGGAWISNGCAFVQRVYITQRLRRGSAVCARRESGTGVGDRYRRWRSVRALEIRRPCNSNGCAFVQRAHITPTPAPGLRVGRRGDSSGTPSNPPPCQDTVTAATEAVGPQIGGAGVHLNNERLLDDRSPRAVVLGQVRAPTTPASPPSSGTRSEGEGK